MDAPHTIQSARNKPMMAYAFKLTVVEHGPSVWKAEFA